MNLPRTYLFNKAKAIFGPFYAEASHSYQKKKKKRKNPS